jgi:hypothetical protein
MTNEEIKAIVDEAYDASDSVMDLTIRDDGQRYIVIQMGERSRRRAGKYFLDFLFDDEWIDDEQMTFRMYIPNDRRDAAIIGNAIFCANWYHVNVTENLRSHSKAIKEQREAEYEAKIKAEEEERKRRIEEREKTDPTIYKGLRRSVIIKAIQGEYFEINDLADRTVWEMYHDWNL